VPAQRSYYRPYYRTHYYRPYYYRPYFYGGYYPGYYGFYGYYPGLYGYYNPFFWGGYYQYPPYYYPVYDNTGSARLQVTPRNTQVYIDGYFVGVVDEFDGYLQRLNVAAGEHELQLYLEGHRPFTQKVLFSRGGTLRLAHTMQPLGPGEASAGPPKPDESVRARPYGSAVAERQAPPNRPGRPSDFGSLLVRVRPSDATVVVDGETWTAREGEDQFVIELAEGPHRIEVRKEGYQTYSATVRVRPGESVRLNVSLTTGGLAGAF
jgi:hypothetical protein